MTPSTARETPEENIRKRTAPGVLYDRLPNDWVHCYACGHDCRIPPGRPGVCKVRYNEAGVLRVPTGYVGALQVDPVEKKPFFHALPGSTALSFGMLGCDYHCGYCQNWLTSQVLRDPAALSPPTDVTPKDLVRLARKHDAAILTSTYNEPLITSEWAVEVFAEARQAGLVTSYVSNGNATPRVLDYLKPWVDLYKVDLKGFDDRHYRSLGGRLDTVLEAIRGIHDRGFWLEVVSLLIPGFNDSDSEITGMAEFLASGDPAIPWHVTAYHDDYKMEGRGGTPAATLVRAAAIGRNAGLHYVYAGNLPGRVGDLENTRCPSCRTLLVERIGYHILSNRMTGPNCPDCGSAIPGRWTHPVRAAAPRSGETPVGPDQAIG